MAAADRPSSFQDIILRLQAYWAAQGCAILQPYDMEVGAARSIRQQRFARWDQSFGRQLMFSRQDARPMGAMAKTRTGCSITINFRF